MEIDHFSFSSLDTFMSCPRKFYLDKTVEKEKHTPVYFATGEMCHKAVLSYLGGAYNPFKPDTLPCLQQMRSQFVCHAKEKDKNKIQFGYCIAVGIAKAFDMVLDVKSLVDTSIHEVRKLLKPSGQYEKEIVYRTNPTCDRGGNEFVARPDYYDDNIVVDFKFVASLAKSYLDDYMRSIQLDLYAELLAAKNGVGVEEKVFILFKKPKETKSLCYRGNADALSDKLAMLFAQDCNDNIQIVRMPHVPGNSVALKEADMIASLISKDFNNKEVFWRNRGQCSKYRGCGYLSECWGVGDSLDDLFD